MGNLNLNLLCQEILEFQLDQVKLAFMQNSKYFRLQDQAGANFDIQIGGINENAEEDNIGPVINLVYE